MKHAVLLLLFILMALLLGFSVSFAIAPDPTGLLPIALGIVLTVVLGSVLYVGLQRRLNTNENSV